MTRYFFDAIDGSKTIDGEGEELADIAAARMAAGRVVAQLLSHRVDHIWAGAPFTVVIRTDEGVVGTITVSADSAVHEPPASR